ncbi:MAG: anthranilate phosphoribosyltransferase, partial [Planctomycetes bacterium]|nr:anthranilate phosphoribosyltransferase [Planctomycetota bacterium]
LAGTERGPKRDIVALNAAAAVIVGGLSDDFESALKIAAASIDEGKAQAALEKLVTISNS